MQYVKNYELFLKKVSKWMNHDGLLFVEHICHKTMAYEYEVYSQVIHQALGLNVVMLPNFSLYLEFDFFFFIIHSHFLLANYYASCLCPQFELIVIRNVKSC